ncbi:hypothetical protein D187_002613 [Cystobacter fuscus DSM 2262]|uniref:Lipoprotein n=1 Tax=Cystobacter fuscus (strain ATCC 25194 / DSM 2262 / NBRC 100088 / M29) TaxID=1242864 RepID=S9QEV7_CYSF2|nr:hypothetical protein [Cystobacter fuscus]EPX59869.1 hypothetical protein D187_002613 [Cystobacter fuscus DSM 2262]
MRAAIIAGLMAAGLLAGCGMSDGQEEISCANGATCIGSAVECEHQCGLSGAKVEPAEPTRTEAGFHLFYCCDSTECINTAIFCGRYCNENERGGICS